ncbi:hypothetical protein [Streptomyces sp. I8-5]|uniref:hypothetical protein n=1 Tax=Streptomyces sp. I8-5 TaxID=3104277 RepID=UPI00386AC5CC
MEQVEQAQQVPRTVPIAVGEVGYREKLIDGRSTNIQKYSDEVPGLNWTQGLSWCQTFQCWVFHSAGIGLLVPMTDSPKETAAWFKERGRYSRHPALGALVFIRAIDEMHVGLVVGYDAEFIHTVEGNTNDDGSPDGNGVYAKRRMRRIPILHGYGLPAYPEGSVSADPEAESFGYKYADTGFPSVVDGGP